jgi:hypothetical protein
MQMAQDKYPQKNVLTIHQLNNYQFLKNTSAPWNYSFNVSWFFGGAIESSYSTTHH